MISNYSLIYYIKYLYCLLYINYFITGNGSSFYIYKNIILIQYNKYIY